MDTNENPQPTKGKPSGKCVRCQQDIEMEESIGELINGVSASVFVMTHIPNTCPHCGLIYQTVIERVRGVETKFIPIKDRDSIDNAGEKPRIVLAKGIPVGLTKKTH